MYLLAKIAPKRDDQDDGEFTKQHQELPIPIFGPVPTVQHAVTKRQAFVLVQFLSSFPQKQRGQQRQKNQEEKQTGDTHLRVQPKQVVLVVLYGGKYLYVKRVL